MKRALTSSVFACLDCGALTTLEQPLRDGFCWPCFKDRLRARTRRLRNRLAAALGLSLGLSLALLFKIRAGPSDAPLARAACLALGALWPAAFAGVFVLGAFIDRLRGLHSLPSHPPRLPESGDKQAQL